jgi:hypothetical protein
MDFIDGVPFIWDDDSDVKKFNNNLNTDFFNKISQPQLPTNIFQQKSVLAETANFDKSAADIEADWFRNAKVDFKGGIKIIEDPDCNCDLQSSVSRVYYNGVDRKDFVGEITVFVSNESKEIKKCFDGCTRIKPDDVVLFYDNATGSFSIILRKNSSPRDSFSNFGNISSNAF